MSNLKNINALNNRVWYVEGGVHPARPPQFLSLGKFGDPSKGLGEAARVGAPDPDNFERDIELGTVPGSRERATFSIEVLYTSIKSILMGWANRGCRVDLYALVGKCGNPQDFAEGGEKWIYFPDGQLSTHSMSNFGAFSTDENNPTQEMVDMTADHYYELLKLAQEQLDSSVTVRELFTVDVWKGDYCEDCPAAEDHVLITMAGANATPGTQPILIYSDDAGETLNQQTIDSMFSNEEVVDSAIIGGYLVLVCKTGNEMHWTNIKDIYEQQNVWNQTDTGFVAGGEPNAITSAGPRHTWLVGDAGYVYFCKDFKTQVEVQDAGTLTAQNLNAVHAYNTENVLAVGNSNAIIYTHNGGVNWATVTGPSVGINMGACWMWSEDVWLVGEGSGGAGRLWLTVDEGRTWTEIPLPTTYNRIDKIEFVSEAEGFIAARSGGQSYVLRTITGGNEWDVVPQAKRAVAIDNSYLSDLAVAEVYSNLVYAVGVDDAGTGGIALKMAG